MADFDLAYLAGLPRPEVIETLDYEAILSARKADFVARAPDFGVEIDVMDLETDPGVILLEEDAYREAVLRARGNDIARARYLYYARGAEIDHLAAFYDVTRLDGETDDRLKERVILAIQGRSTGGTAPRYKAVAMGASLSVADVHVYADGLTPIVNLAVLSTATDGVADQALLDTVSAAVNAETVRMVNDTLLVRSAVRTVVNVTASLVLLPSMDQARLVTLAADLPGQWIAESGLGRDLTPDWIRSKLMVPGVHSIASLTPSTTAVADPHEVVRIGAVTLTIAGRDS